MVIIKALRHNIRGIQVPRATFVNDEGHKVIFQGMIHIGIPSFYKKIRKSANDFSGEVHFEGIRNADSNIKSDTLKMSYEILANLNGVESQTQHLSKDYIRSNPEKFKNYDLDYESIESFFSSRDFKEGIEGLAETKTDVFSNRLLMNAMFNPFVMFKTLTKQSDVDSDENVVAERDSLSFSKAVETKKSDKDVMMVWGAKHLGGVSEKLSNSGYKIEKVEWDTVIPWSRSERIPYHVRKGRLLSLHKKVNENIASDEWKNAFSHLEGEEESFHDKNSENINSSEKLNKDSEKKIVDSTADTE